MVEQHLVQAVKVRPVPQGTWLVPLEPVFADPDLLSSPELAVLPESFLRESTFGLVNGLTERMLAEFDKFGLPLPHRMVGPVLLPAEHNEQWLVKVWVAPDYVNIIHESAVVRIVDELMTNGGHELLTMEDRRFLVGYHPSYQLAPSDPDSAYYKLFTLSLASKREAAGVSD